MTRTQIIWGAALIGDVLMAIVKLAEWYFEGVPGTGVWYAMMWLIYVGYSTGIAALCT